MLLNSNYSILLEMFIKTEYIFKLKPLYYSESGSTNITTYIYQVF